MPQLTLSVVAKMYGMHRTTLYAAIKAGRVSASCNRKGQKVIELSEAIRAWGEPEGRPGHEFDSSTPVNTGVSTHSTAPVEYMTEATALRLAAAMERLIEIEEAKLLLIEHKPGDMSKTAHIAQTPMADKPDLARPQAVDGKTKVIQPHFKDGPRSFADLLAGLD